MFKQVARSTQFIASQVANAALFTDSLTITLANGAIAMEIASTNMVNEALADADLTMEQLFAHRTALRSASDNAKTVVIAPIKA